MDSLDKFLEFRIERITSDQAIPVDLASVCAHIGAVVEEREMIPEAAMQVADGQFRIYLQNNFIDAPGTRIRRRFSLAHELGHTLFYEDHNGEIKSRRDAPRGENLEAACHRAASMILVPSKVLRTELKKQPPADVRSIVEFAARFEVSVEVMIRRLSEFGVFEHGWAPALTRIVGGVQTIEYAAYPTWMKSHLTPPVRGTPFSRWFRGSAQPDGAFMKESITGVLEASPVRLSGTSIIFELRMRS